MKTAEEILDKYTNDGGVSINGAIDAMQEYANQFIPSKISIGEIEKVAKEKGDKHKFILPEDNKFYQESFCEGAEWLQSILASDAVEFFNWFWKQSYYEIEDGLFYSANDKKETRYTIQQIYSLFSSNKEGKGK